MGQQSNVASVTSPEQKPGPFLARVVSHLDPTYMGILEVEILRPVGNTSEGSQLHQVKYLSPFYGVTGAEYVGQDPNDYNDTQKSYGMWMIPPDVGTTVVIFFIDADPKRGYWMGCVADENMNFMVPGLAATANAVDGVDFQDSAGRPGRIPVAEYNKKNNTSNADPTGFTKPKHPLATVLTLQGLVADDTRGITTSSARRETPSMVFGISTPGPLDKNANAKRGAMGKNESSIPDAFVSRLGGTTFVMDDGDDKFLRKTAANEGPPEYASVESGDTSGNVNIPHNELFRIRTRTGHQILLHNSEDLIYIGNAKGTTWIELTSNGKIDIYAKDSISVHTENDLNFTADRDINFNAKGNINLNATQGIFATAAKTFDIKAGTDGKIQAVANLNLKSAHHIETAGTIDMNGPAAAAAIAAKIPARVPTFEPWQYHEHLDPTAFTKDKTVAVAVGAAAPAKPAYFNKYTTSTDTFNKGAK